MNWFKNIFKKKIETKYYYYILEMAATGSKFCNNDMTESKWKAIQREQQINSILE